MRSKAPEDYHAIPFEFLVNRSPRWSAGIQMERASRQEERRTMKRPFSAETKVSVLWRISRKLKRQSFQSDSSEWRGPLFLCLLFILSSYIPVLTPWFACLTVSLFSLSVPRLPSRSVVKGKRRGTRKPARNQL